MKKVVFTSAILSLTLIFMGQIIPGSNSSGTTTGPLTITGTTTFPALKIPNGTNPEFGGAGWNSNVFEIGNRTNGGSARHVRISNDGSSAGILFNTNGGDKWFIDQNGNWETGGGHAVDGSATPTITSGFGTTPAIAGSNWALRVTLGNPVGSSGIVAFNQTYSNAPACDCNDETTVTAGCSATPTTTQVTLSTSFGTWVAGDKVSVTCRGF